MADTQIAFGKPTIAGARVLVGIVVGKLGGGMTLEEVMDEYVLEREDVLAALSYAAELVAGERVRGIA